MKSQKFFTNFIDRFNRKRHRTPNHRDVIEIPQTAISGDYNEYLSLACIVGEEVPYIREWTAFHYAVGFETIHLYMNKLNVYEETVSEIADFIESGFVTITKWPNIFKARPNIFKKKNKRRILVPQKYAYAHAIATLRGKARWLALIDVDEFLFSPEYDDLKNALEHYEAYPAVAVFWKNFSSGKLTNKPKGLVIENYLDAAIDSCHLNKQMKSIVQPARILGVSGAHKFFTDTPKVVAFTEKGEPLGNWNHRFNIHSNNSLRLNHYHNKSEEEFFKRLNSSFVTTIPQKRAKKIKNYSLIEAAVERDEVIQKFVARTKDVMKNGPCQ